MFVSSKDCILRNMVWIIDVLHQNVLGMLLYELGCSMGLSAGN